MDIDGQRGNAMHLSLLTFSMLSDHRSGGLDADGLCAAAAASGLYRLDLLEAEAAAYGEEALLAAMRAHGLRCDCLISALPFYLDPDTLPERLERALALARRLGAGMLMVIPGQDDEAACSACTGPQLFQRAVEVFRLAVARGAACGITVGFENTRSPGSPSALRRSAARCWTPSPAWASSWIRAISAWLTPTPTSWPPMRC